MTPVMGPSRRPRRVLLAVAGAVVLAVVGALAAWRLVLDDPGDVINPDVPFVAPKETTPERAPSPRKKKRRHLAWPRYGYTKAHTRVFQPPQPMRRRWRQVWQHRAPALLEFPPVISGTRLFQLADNGLLFALRKGTGRMQWKRRIGRLSASSPAVWRRTVYATVLVHRRRARRGRIVALRMRTGRIRWSRSLSSRSESSPLVHRGRVYFGSESGTLYCLDARTGRTKWTYRASGAIKGSPSLSRGLLYFGDYGGRVHAVRARDGRRIWSVAPARRLVRSGRFYATAAVAFGRVYIGATDGRQYSLSARDGKLAWAKQTGGYVYSSAAVHNVGGVGPMVFFGSYDGWFYALGARTGQLKWRHRSGGRISGSPTIVGGTVYYSDLGRQKTIGLRTRDGRVVFRRRFGAFDPMVSDGRWLFLTGRSSLTALRPVTRSRRAARRRARSADSRRRRSACVLPAPCRAIAWLSRSAPADRARRGAGDAP
jgi:outer membrane protein assembly factor BamB